MVEDEIRKYHEIERMMDSIIGKLLEQRLDCMSPYIALRIVNNYFSLSRLRSPQRSLGSAPKTIDYG